MNQTRKDRILISVVMHSYNRASLIGRAIESVMNQDVDADIELLIGDNCSTEDTRSVYDEYIAKYPEKIKVFYRERNVGIASNWAQLIMACRGKYVCNCDNDDFWHNPQKLQIQLDYMEAHPEANILFTGFRKLDTATNEITELLPYTDDSQPLQKAMWHGGGGGRDHISTMMFRRDFVCEHVRFSDFVENEFSVQDWIFYVILSAYTKFDTIPTSTATFTVNSGSFTHPVSYEVFEKRLQADFRGYKYLSGLFPQMFPFSEDEWEKYQNYRLMGMAYQKGDFSAARKYGEKAGKSFKQKCSQNRLLFEVYRFFRWIKGNRI